MGLAVHLLGAHLPLVWKALPITVIADADGLLGESLTMESYFILYVRDQAQAASFYAAALGVDPRLNMPGMTEFDLPAGGVLGLMPEEGIKRLLGESLPDPSSGRGIPRAELYLMVQDPARHHAQALKAGAKELSKLAPRAWGHSAAYSLDLDGHVLAFASVTASPCSAA